MRNASFYALACGMVIFLTGALLVEHIPLNAGESSQQQVATALVVAGLVVGSWGLGRMGARL